MMNVLKSVFGVCSGSAEKSEVHDTVRRIFGNDMVMKENTERNLVRSKYLSHIKENLPKMLDSKVVTSPHKSKPSKKHTAVVIVDNVETQDDRPGRVGPKIMVFDASTGTGRLVLVGDERVSVQGLSSFATIRATACVFAGRWMYEVQLGTKGIMQIGWCTSSCLFSMDTGVGDTANSYAYDGGRVRKWNVATSPYGLAWLPGDVIGSCIDLDNGTLEYFRNGVSMGVAFTNVTHGNGVAYFPAVSLAMQEHLYANFGHVPFVFPQDDFAPLQLPPVRECARAALLFKSIDALLEELARFNDLRPVSAKSSKARSETSRAAEEEVALRIHSSNSTYTPKPSPHQVAVTSSSDSKKMSRKAFLMSLARLAVVELGISLRLSYVVVSELLPRLRGALGVKNRAINVDLLAAEFYIKARERNFTDISSKFLAQAQPKFCTLLDLLWTFLDEAALCDILEHCVVRECLLFDLVSPDMEFTQQLEGVYVLCGLMQHVETRHHLVKYVFFNKISFDNFLNVKCPDEAVLKTVVRNPWWQKPTPVQGETDPRIAEMAETGTIARPNPFPGDPKNEYLTSFDDVKKETQYKEDCNKITRAVAPLEQIQLEFLLMLLDNSDGTNMVPSTRKIFMEKFRRYIMDNCILDMRLFNISRNSPAISWCCHARLLSAVLKLWDEKPLGQTISSVPPYTPPKAYIDGELDYYNVDRLGGVLPFLVRTLRQDLINVLGEENPFVQSFEPTYNRGGGIDMGVSGEMGAGSPGIATLPQVISSMARFMHATLPPIPNRSTGETALALKGTRSMMPGAGSINVRTGYLRLLDGLLALYHGSAIKHAEKLCELRDNQQDMADCLHDIEHRIAALTSELKAAERKKISESDIPKKEMTEKILEELERSKNVYEEKLNAGALQMAWVIGAVWTQNRQADLAKHFAGTLHSMRLASDSEYAAHTQVASKEILPGKSSLLGSYASLQLEYTDSSSNSPQTPNSTTATPRNASNTQVGSANQGATREFSEPLFAFVPEYHVDAMLEICNTLRLYMHPTVPVHQIPEWEDLMVSCASFLCSEFADTRIVLASTRESLVQTLASFATQPPTMRAIERVPVKHQMCMVEELIRPYQNRAWAQSNWVLVRFWHGSGFGFRHRQWPHLAARYGDREPTVNNLGAKVDAGLMSQCFGPCPSEVIQQRIRDYIISHPKEAASFFNSLLSQLNWAFSEFITMMQEVALAGTSVFRDHGQCNLAETLGKKMDRVNVDSNLESRQIKLCATCFDLYHGLARALEMALCLAPTVLTKAEACDKQNELLLGRTCQILMAVVSRVCVRAGGGAGFARLVARGLPDTDRVHYYVALAPVAGCIIRMLDPKLPQEHLDRATKALVSEPLFHIEGLDFMLGKCKRADFSFYNYPDDVTVEELKALETVVEKLRAAKTNMEASPGGSGTQSELLCTICYARPADTAFMPCGHHSCRACVMQHMLNSKQCFFCKAEIESVREIEPANN